MLRKLLSVTPPVVLLQARSIGLISTALHGLNSGPPPSCAVGPACLCLTVPGGAPHSGALIGPGPQWSTGPLVVGDAR